MKKAPRYQIAVGLILTGIVVGCSSEKYRGKTTVRTIPSEAPASLPQKYTSGDAVGSGSTANINTTGNTAATTGGTTATTPAGTTATTGGTTAGNTNTPTAPCDSGVVINGVCQALSAIHRCRSNFDTAFYTNHIYVSDAAECTAANYVFEAQTYFYALPGLDKTLVRWFRTGLSGNIQHYYLQPGETVPADYAQPEGPAFTISANDFAHARKVALYRCVVNCGRLDNHPRCDPNMQWISLDPNCEGNGTGPGAVLGFAIAP